MNELFPISDQAVQTFVLMLIRVGTLLALFPFFSSRAIPVMVKSGLALVITLALFSTTEMPELTFPGSIWGFFPLVLTELVLGMTLAIMVQVFFEGVRMMGQMVGFQTGFAIANVLDPQNGVQISILGNLAYMTAMLVFLYMDGHHLMLSALRESFELHAVGALKLDGEMMKRLLDIYGSMFVIAIKMGAPAIAALLFVQAAFGMVSRFIPQMNIMIVAFPVQISVGLFFFGICLKLLVGFVGRFIEDLAVMLTQVVGGASV